MQRLASMTEDQRAARLLQMRQSEQHRISSETEDQRAKLLQLYLPDKSLLQLQVDSYPSWSILCSVIAELTIMADVDNIDNYVLLLHHSVCTDYIMHVLLTIYMYMYIIIQTNAETNSSLSKAHPHNVLHSSSNSKLAIYQLALWPATVQDAFNK